MPYVQQEVRTRIDREAYIPAMRDAGQLNYHITRVILRYLNDNGERYQTMNDITGVLGNVADEFRRRVVHPYEDTKREENGDIYE